MPAVTIRSVPNATLDELAVRAVRRGRSLQEYLRQTLIDLADRPDMAAVLDEIRTRKRATGTTMSVAQILELRDSGRE